jgi:hypothetical protein
MADAFSDTAVTVIREAPNLDNTEGFLSQEQRLYVTKLYAAATNHTLATELYLKSCLLVHLLDRVRGHDVSKLYQSVEPEQRLVLESRYQAALREVENDTRIDEGDSFVIAYGAFDDDFELPDRPRTLADLLAYVNSSFTEYRYMFEVTYERRIVYCAYEIEAACRALRAYHFELMESRIGVPLDPPSRAG